MTSRPNGHPTSSKGTSSCHGTQEIHVQSRLARIVHQAGDEEDIAVPEGHAKGPAVRSDLDVVNLLTM
jgi:hypothetical protein